MNYKVVMAYDGSRYNGWQKQGNTDKTIQGKLEQILFKMTGEEIEVHGSGRPFLGGGGRFQFRLRDGPTYSGRQLDSVFGRFFPERLCDEQNENRLQRKEFLVTSDRVYPYR